MYLIFKLNLIIKKKFGRKNILKQVISLPLDTGDFCLKMWFPNTKCHSEVFLGNGVLEIYSKFTGEHLYWNHTSAWVLSCKFAVNFQNDFS